MTHRIGPKGQVVIPKQLRDELDLRAGDEVTFWREGDHVAVKRADLALALRGRFAGRPLVATLEEERARDRDRERSR
jgi:AbrB family looped-hinge helix DNA binding protein